jgi:hypothetical protein
MAATWDMSDDELRANLAELGIEGDAWRTVVLLPLVQVAWADGKVQKAERKRIYALAEEHGLLTGSTSKILEGWLNEAPTDDEYNRARRALSCLARRGRGGEQLHIDDTLPDVVQLCQVVATAAGGLFGMAFTVHDNEAGIIRDIARELAVEPVLLWSHLHGAD